MDTEQPSSARRLRIAIVIPDLRAGGAERSAVAIGAMLSDVGQNVTLLTLGDPGSDAYAVPVSIERRNLLRTPLPGQPRRFLKKLSALRQELATQRYDLVIALLTTTAVQALLASTATPVIVCERSNPDRYQLPWVLEQLRRRLYRRSAALVVQSERAAERFQARYARLPPITVIPNTIAEVNNGTLPHRMPASVVPTERRFVLSIGRLDRGKGMDRLLDSFASVAEAAPDIDLVLLGEGPERAALLQQASRLGLAQRLYLPGRVGNLTDWYRRATVFALASYYEGFPNVLLEAMAEGCACVSFDIDFGPREIIQHGVDGLLIPDGQLAELSTALIELCADESLRRALAEEAPITSQRFRPETLAPRWLALCQQVLAPGR